MTRGLSEQIQAPGPAHPHSRRQPHVPVVRLDLPCRGNVPVCSVCAPQVQETRGNAFAAHSRRAPPPHPPRLFKLFCRRKGCSQGQKSATQVVTPSNLDGQNDEARSTSSAHQLWVPAFLAPSVSAAPVCGKPLQCKAHTRVVSKANWDPPKIGTTSNVRLSAATGRGKSRSRTRTFVVTRAPASRHTRAAAFSSDPMPLFWCIVHGGGQTNRLDGHTCACTERTAMGRRRRRSKMS